MLRIIIKEVSIVKSAYLVLFCARTILCDKKLHPSSYALPITYDPIFTDGFHKITSIDNGGLRFDRDEMEFSHPCFQKGHAFLLEHIKRKIAHPKPQEEKNIVKVEAVNRMLGEVKAMRGRQDALDSRFSSMKQENEALWREVAILRQKHLKQQQIVNKVCARLF